MEKINSSTLQQNNSSTLQQKEGHNSDQVIIPPKVVEVYVSVGKMLHHYKSGIYKIIKYIHHTLTFIM